MLNYKRLGTSALLAIDNINNYLILHTVLHNGDFGNPTFIIINLANMKVRILVKIILIIY